VTAFCCSAVQLYTVILSKRTLLVDGGARHSAQQVSRVNTVTYTGKFGIRREHHSVVFVGWFERRLHRVYRGKLYFQVFSECLNTVNSFAIANTYLACVLLLKMRLEFFGMCSVTNRPKKYMCRSWAECLVPSFAIVNCYLEGHDDTARLRNTQAVTSF